MHKLHMEGMLNERRQHVPGVLTGVFSLSRNATEFAVRNARSPTGRTAVMAPAATIPRVL